MEKEIAIGIPIINRGKYMKLRGVGILKESHDGKDYSAYINLAT